MLNETRVEKGSEMNMNIELADIIKSIVSYNGLEEYVKRWSELSLKNGSITCPKDYGVNENDKEDLLFDDALIIPIKSQLQIIWMICVLMYGDYGTSPRFGWIYPEKGFYEFIDYITK